MQKLDESLLTDLRIGYNETEVEAISQFMMPFCLTGRIYLVRLLERVARLRIRPDFKDLMDLLKRQYKTEWSVNSERIGDPDDVKDGNGLRNTVAYFYVYRQFGLTPKGLY